MHQDRPIITPPLDLAPFMLPGESIVQLIELPERHAERYPSSVRELYRLTQATTHEEVGEFGPILASLALETIQGDAPEELHRYEALFGRDSLRVALDLLPLYPRLTRTTILSLARLQGLEYNAVREEEPGRIIHESRDIEDTVRQELTDVYGWDWPYYGSVDATPEFIRTIAAYCVASPEGDDFLTEKYYDKNNIPRIISESLVLAVDWLTHRMDTNPEGLIESFSSIPHGIENQVWKDSWDSYSHADGTLANPHQGIASVEVQRLTYDALIDAAEIYEASLERPIEAEALRERAARLKMAIFKEFWTDDKGGYFVLGTDRDNDGTLRQLKIRTSNMGHMLHSRLLEGDDATMIRYREAIISQLFSPEMLTASGIRTLASDEVRFRPGAYHNGSVWVWDTNFIVSGLRRHGYNEHADILSERLLNIIDVTKKFPEYVRGGDESVPTLTTRIVDVWDETHQRVNRVEQPPQEVQAWTVAAIVAIKHYYATIDHGDIQLHAHDDDIAAARQNDQSFS